MAFWEDIYSALRPVVDRDDEHDFAARKYLQAVADPFEEIRELARDTDDRPGWGDLLDPDGVPAKGLGYLAQFLGVKLRAGLTESQQRDRIKSTDGWHRGTPAAMKAAARSTLTGSQTLYFRERDTSPYHLTINTLTSETPDPAATLKELLRQKPAGLVLVHSVIDGQDYQELRDTTTDYADVKASYGNYEDAKVGS